MTTLAAAAGPAARSLPAAAGPLAVVLIAALAAVLQTAVLPTGSDVSWLLTVGDRMLAGERLYVDVLESNPPASVLLYLPAVMAEHATGIRAETIVVVATLALALAGLAASARLLALAGRPLSPAGLAVAAVVLLILPMGAFAQREHLALIAVLPLSALAVARLAGHSPTAATAIGTGLGAGIAMAIKPPFALAILLPALGAAALTRSLRPLVRLEHVVAGVVVVAYGIAIHLAFPAFFDTMMPILRDVYLPASMPLATVFLQPGVLWLAALLALTPVYAGRRLADPATMVAWSAAVGLAAAFAIQHKGWAYHALPATALALAAAGFAVADPAGRVGSLRRIFAAFALAAALKGGLWMAENDTDLSDLRARAGPLIAGRTVTAITSDIAVANPLTRDLGGRFVGTMVAQWMTAAAYAVMASNLDDKAVLAMGRAYEARDRAYLSDDILRRKPDVVLVEHLDFDWLDWARKDPRFAGAFDGAYERVLTASGIEVWRRLPDLRGGLPAG